jgi:segregation and condensation protein B
MALELKHVVEALVFAASKPITARQLLQTLQRGNAASPIPLADLQEVREAHLETILRELQQEWQEPRRGLILQELAGGWRFGTHAETAPWVRLLFDETKPTKLSQPAVETLAIIAYRQPISRADIEAVRGVAVDGVVATLLERRLIKLAGRSEAPGRPLLYETTPDFLETFGLKGLHELPNAAELRRIPLPKSAPSPEVPVASTELLPREDLTVFPDDPH